MKYFVILQFPRYVKNAKIQLKMKHSQVYLCTLCRGMQYCKINADTTLKLSVTKIFQLFDFFPSLKYSFHFCKNNG